MIDSMPLQAGQRDQHHASALRLVAEIEAEAVRLKGVLQRASKVGDGAHVCNVPLYLYKLREAHDLLFSGARHAYRAART